MKRFLVFVELQAQQTQISPSCWEAFVEHNRDLSQEAEGSTLNLFLFFLIEKDYQDTI